MKKTEILNDLYYVKSEQIHTVPVKLNQSFKCASKTILKKNLISWKRNHRKSNSAYQLQYYQCLQGKQTTHLFVVCFWLSESASLWLKAWKALGGSGWLTRAVQWPSWPSALGAGTPGLHHHTGHYATLTQMWLTISITHTENSHRSWGCPEYPVISMGLLSQLHRGGVPRNSS